MDSPNLNSLMMDKENSSVKSINKEKKIDQQMLNQIEFLIQQQFQISVPALVFEYKPSNNSNDFTGWDYEDLYEFFSHFGEIDILEIHGKISFILFKTFIDAYTSREFLMNSSNFKETEKNNFIVRWYSQDDEYFITELLRNKLKKYTPSRMVENINSNTSDSFNYYGMNIGSNDQMVSNLNNQFNYYSSWSINPNARNEINSIMGTNSQNKSFNYYEYEDSQSFSSDKCLVNGKYTCRFNILIENDLEFQVARRLIGAKGCNMKKIVELCSIGPDGKFINDAVKLRLRGRGSGYKEGPYNRESDDQLHLCISSKYYDKYKKASFLVQELIINIYEEYKRFCERNNKIPVGNLTIQKEEGVSTRKSITKVNPIYKDHFDIMVDNYS